MKILPSYDAPTVRYKSSISQHKGPLAVMKKGEWCPISYDVLDFIDCETVRSHRAYVTSGDDLGWHFPVGECILYTNEYVYHDNYITELRTLPEWFGAGLYKATNASDAFINSDLEALGVVNKYRLRVGLNYAIADKTLPGE